MQSSVPPRPLLPAAGRWLRGAYRSSERVPAGPPLYYQNEVADRRWCGPARGAGRPARLPADAAPAACIDRLLSGDPKLEQIDRFLSAEQCRTVRQIAERRGGPWQPYSAELGPAESKFLLPLEVDAEPLLREIDQRASRWIGLPEADRTGLWLKRHRASDGDDDSNDGSARRTPAVPANVHVDNHRMPHRLGTVIIYCEPVTNSSGGGTVFPCLLEPARNSAAKHKTAELRKNRVEQCIAAGSAPPTGRVTAYGQAHDPFGLWQLSVDACANRAPALKTRPTVGSAVMHRTGVPDNPDPGAMIGGGGLDFRLFHTGCPVAPHAEKFTIQKFGERPPSVRVAETWPEDVPSSTRELFQQADRDSNKRLDETELGLLHPPLNDIGPYSAAAAAAAAVLGTQEEIDIIGRVLLSEVDADGSGAVELLEFSANGHHWKGAARRRETASTTGE